MAVKGRWGTLTKMNKLYIKVMAARIKLFFQGGGRKLTIYGVISHTNDYGRYTHKKLRVHANHGVYAKKRTAHEFAVYRE